MFDVARFDTIYDAAHDNRRLTLHSIFQSLFTFNTHRMSPTIGDTVSTNMTATDMLDCCWANTNHCHIHYVYPSVSRSSGRNTTHRCI